MFEIAELSNITKKRNWSKESFYRKFVKSLLDT